MPACLARARRLAVCRWALALAGGLAVIGPASGQAPEAGCLKLPFAQQVDVQAVLALAQAQPAALLPRIASLGIDVLRVPGAGPDRPPNPLLAGLPLADERLLAQAGFQPGYEGRAIPAGAECCGLKRAAVLIRETASTYTLLHEVVHLLIVPADGAVMRADLETRFATSFRRLDVYQRRLYDDPWRLLNPLWRRDILQALQDVSALLFDRLRIGQSQEAIAEQVLAGCIDQGSPFFDAARRAEGRRYGEAMIDNAVDVFNALHAATTFGEDTVRQLRADLVAGRIEAGEGGRLTAQDEQAFVAGVQGVRQELERVRREIESLKTYYRP